MSKVQDAIDWILSGDGRSQYEASKKFDVGQSAISVAMKKHRADLAAYELVGAEKMRAVELFLIENPGASRATVAESYGVPLDTLRAAVRGSAVAARMRTLRAGIKRPMTAEEMREKCAKVAEVYGAEGAMIAASIRALGV